jgi:hypothetical protein
MLSGLDPLADEGVLIFAFLGADEARDDGLRKIYRLKRLREGLPAREEKQILRLTTPKLKCAWGPVRSE